MDDVEADGPEIVLRLNGISKRFGPLVANDSISFVLRRGEIVGLLGENGAGKTTLMNILFGHYVADEGSIDVEGVTLQPGSPGAAIAAGVGMVHQHFTLADNLSVLDNIVLGTEPLHSLFSDRGKARARIGELSNTFGLAVDPDAMVSTLSVGERQRVEILKALYRQARILILDEPTAVLTPQESESLFATLKKFVAKGLSIIFISHKLNEVLAACNRISILRAGKLVATREAATVSKSELAELMVGRTIPEPRIEAQKPGEALLSLSNLSAQRGSQVLKNVSLDLHAGEILGMAGVSGNGQSLIADVISGTQSAASGEILFAGKMLTVHSPQQIVQNGVARIPEDRHAEGLLGDMSVTENVISESYRNSRFCKHGLVDWGSARKFAQQIIEKYEVKCPSPEARVRLLSGGNMQKLILGRVMAGEPSIVLANQPSRGLDVGAVNYVHQQLIAARKRGAAILLISEDLDELLALSDRIAVMHRGELSEAIGRKDFNINTIGLMMAGAAHAA